MLYLANLKLGLFDLPSVGLYQFIPVENPLPRIANIIYILIQPLVYDFSRLKIVIFAMFVHLFEIS